MLVGCGFLLGLMPALFNLFVDPYELIVDRERSNKTTEIAEKAHYPLWKLGGYQQGKYEAIVLGDSRARALREKYWNSFDNSLTKNLAYGGGTIPEIYETFKLVRDDPTLETLIIGIQLRSFDEDHKQGMNRVPEAVSLISAPSKYLFNWSIAKTSLKIANKELGQFKNWVGGFTVGPTPANAASENASLVEPRSHRKGADRLTQTFQESRILPDKFARQITRNARSDWRGFEFSEKYWSFIEEIGQWAADRNKKIVFVIPPTIVEMQKTITDHGHKRLNESLRRRLAQYGVVFDFDYPDELTRNIDNFSDAYHFNAKIARQIVGEVIGHIASDYRVLLRVTKRRKIIRCADFLRPKKIHDEVPKTVTFEPGSNCRIWSSTKL